MAFTRRDFLVFLGASAGAGAAATLLESPLTGTAPIARAASLPFPILQGAMPLVTDGIATADQPAAYASFAVVDDLLLPEGYTYDVIAAWGDRVGDSRFGYNNDYLSYVETGPDEGVLTVNFEYISSNTWMATYPAVIGKSLDTSTVTAAAPAGVLDAFSLSETDPVKVELMAIAKEAMLDLGIGVISIHRTPDGTWERTFSNRDRRITGISGLEDGRYLKATGPAVTAFGKTNKMGYEDGLGANIIGTFGNCAGGTTPWGTVLSAEENIQNLVPEPVMPDGSSLDPSTSPFKFASFQGLGNIFGLAGNKYGWMVEVDPVNPEDCGTKHTWLGRYRHEAVAFRAEADKPLAVYSGCDRQGGHLYKFVSTQSVTDPTDKANSRLMEDGMLYAAKFNPDGSGKWIPLNPSTPVKPVRPSDIFGRGGEPVVSLPQRPDGGIFQAESNGAIAAFRARFATLGDLYAGTDEQKQGAILIDAHYAANAAGATATARPEDTDIAPDGSLFIAFTSGSPGSDGGPDKVIFRADGAVWEYGWIVKLVEDGNEPGAMTFTWNKFAVGGEPAEGGLGFANPDNLEFDRNGSLWMVTDMSTSRHNLAVPSDRVDAAGEPIGQSRLRGLYGNNSVWYVPTADDWAGQAFLFGYGPMESEMTGPFFTADNSTLFLAAQHPGELHGIRRDMAFETRQYEMRTTDGQPFTQTRQVPLGSNWPDRQPNVPPRPAVVAIRRIDRAPLV